MSDGAELSFDAAKIARDADRIVRRHLSAGTSAVATTTKQLERKLEAATQGAAPGKLARAWQSTAFPRSGPAKDPAGTIWLRGGARTRGAVQFFTMPGEVRGKRGQYLAVPLPAAGAPARGRTPYQLTPADWEKRTGLTLRPVFRPGKAPLLVADEAVLSGRRQLARGNTARRVAAGRGSATVPIFVLLPVLKFRNAFAIVPLLAASEAELVKAFITAVTAVQ